MGGAGGQPGGSSKINFGDPKPVYERGGVVPRSQYFMTTLETGASLKLIGGGRRNASIQSRSRLRHDTFLMGHHKKTPEINVPLVFISGRGNCEYI